MALVSQTPLVVLLFTALLALSSSTSTQPIPTHKGIEAHELPPIIPIHKVIAQYGFPLGLFPDSVETYSLSRLEVGWDFIIYLKNPCEVMYHPGFILRYKKEITGQLSRLHITKMNGLEMNIPDAHGGIAAWLPVDDIKVSDDDNYLLFTLVEVFTLTYDMVLFESIPTCTNVTHDAAFDPSPILVSKLPVTAT